MKLPLSWLKEYVPIDVSPEELSIKLPGIGFEVEEIVYTGANIERVVVGKIIDKKKHFGADRLQICTVDVGSEITTVVTAATNISVGDKVPVALDGADLPTGKHITAGDLRGVTSYGMFCSGAELMIDDTVIEGAEVNGILILPPETEIGADIRKVLGLDEYVLDISVTANRPDCQSVYGMAREIAALYSVKPKKLALGHKSTAADLKVPAAKIESGAACSLYTGTIVADIAVGPSPKWMRDRLRAVGIRPINNVVDITNYVLAEVGQPLHAFDLGEIAGDVAVRLARGGEKIVVLDGKEYALTEKMTVIADSAKPLAIAGVMGGEHSGITDKTAAVFLEAARFDKESVRGTSRALGLRSDSSARYEKGVDYPSVETGRDRALHLFEQLKAGKVTTLSVRDGMRPPEEKTITTSAQQINDLFGVEVPRTAMVRILKSLGFGAETNGDTLVCTVPLFREDVDNYTDLAEEIIRFYGYDRLTPDLMKYAHTTAGGLMTEQKNIAAIKNDLVSLGGYECYTYSFINKKQFDRLGYDKGDPRRLAIPILNPLSEEFAVMRTQLVGSMLETVALNHSRKNKDFRLFEVAKTYLAGKLPLETLPEEHDTLCIAYCGKGEDFYKLKFAVNAVLAGRVEYEIVPTEAPYLHPGIGADIVVSGEKIGSFGKVHPTVAENFDIPAETFVAEIDLMGFVSREKAAVRYRAIPKFPVVERDLAVVVDEARTVGELKACIIKACGALFDSIELFDVYRGEQVGEGKKSVAFSIKLRSDEKTLVDEQIQATMSGVIEALKNDFGAELRA